MKKIYVFLIMLLSVFSFAQEKSDSIKIAKISVYPGCEKFEDNKELVRCMGEKLSMDILRFLDTEFPYTFPPKKTVTAQIEFMVDENGQMTDIAFIDGDKEFMNIAEQAVSKTKDYLIRKEKRIQPAVDIDGNIVAMIFRRGITLQNPDYEDELATYLSMSKGYTLDEIKEVFIQENLKFREKRIKRLIEKTRK